MSYKRTLAHIMSETPMEKAMRRWPGSNEELQGGELPGPPSEQLQNLATPMQMASQMAPQGIPWQEWRRSTNVEDQRDPQQGGINMMKQYFQTLQMLQFLQSGGKPQK